MDNDRSDASYDGIVETPRGDIVMTKSGRYFPIMDPRPSDFHLFDVSFHLSNIMRFGGATSFPVTGHIRLCVALAKDLFPGDKDLHKYAAAHDIPEFVCGDMVRPMKRNIPEFRQIEGKVMSACAEWLELKPLNNTQKDQMRFIDNLSCSTEREAFLPYAEPWLGMPDPALEYVSGLRDEASTLTREQHEAQFILMMFSVFPDLFATTEGKSLKHIRDSFVSTLRPVN